MTTMLPAMYANQLASRPPDPTPLPPDPTPIPQARPSTAPGAASPLAGFDVSAASAVDQQNLANALVRIQSSTIGAALLNSVRGKGVAIQVVDDASFNRETQNRATDAVAVFASSATTQPRLIVRSSSIAAGGDPADAVHVIAHELTHALQFLAGENEQTYRSGAARSGTTVSAEQARTGVTLMKEAGAESVAGAIDAQLNDPVAFAQKGAKNIGAAEANAWKVVAGIASYNPQGQQLPTVVSPISDRLLRSALGLG